MFGGTGARLRLRFAFEMDFFLARAETNIKMKSRQEKRDYGVIMGLVLALLHGVEKFWVFSQ